MDLDFLRNVAKPTRYTGGEVNEVVKAEVRRPLPSRAGVPRRLRHRHVHHGPQDPLRHRQPPRRHLGRARLHAHARHGGGAGARGLPLYGLESKRPLSDFDAVGFTLQFELTYTNILHMLGSAACPLRAADRGPADPVILAGGPCAVNPEPLAPFMDAVFIGDGEEGLLELCEAVRATRGGPAARSGGRWRRWKAPTCPALYRTEMDPATGMEVVTGPSRRACPFPCGAASSWTLTPYPVPRQRHRAPPRGGARPLLHRDRAGLRRGVPLLPGGVHLPPGARARARRRAGLRARGPGGHRVQRGHAS